MNGLKNIGKVLLIILTIGLTGSIDYAAAFDRVALDEVRREFYFLPILLGALWFGPRGGLLTSLCSVYVVLPAAFLHAESASTFETGYLLEAAALVGFGLVAAFAKQFRSLRLPSWASLSLRKRLLRSPQSLLLCLEEPREAEEAARALLRHFELGRGVCITVMGVVRDPQREQFQSFEAFYRAVQEEDATMRGAISEAMNTLTQEGIPENRLRSRVLMAQTTGAVRDILISQQFKDYETILLGSHRLKGSKVTTRGRSGKRHRLPRLAPALEQLV